MKYPLGVALLTLSTFAVTSCAKERDPIDRTQPNALKKSFFVGDKLQDPSDDPEFYAQGTLIDVGYGAAQDGLFTSTYAQPVSRIKWVIQEKQLIGRLTYERIDHLTGAGAGSPEVTMITVNFASSAAWIEPGGRVELLVATDPSVVVTGGRLHLPPCSAVVVAVMERTSTWP